MADLTDGAKAAQALLAGAAVALALGESGCGPGAPAVDRDHPSASPAAHPGARTIALEDSEDWKTVAGAWDYGMPLAASGRSTKAQREEAARRFQAARDAARRLAGAGLLSSAEAGLLGAECDKVMADILLRPPTDTTLTCYMQDVATAESVSGRLARRLPLIRKLAGSGKVHEAALRKILEAVDADVAVLYDERELRWLREEDRAKAVKHRDEVKVQAAKLRAGLEAPRP